MFENIPSAYLLCFALTGSGAMGLWFQSICSRHGEAHFKNYEIPAASLISLAEFLVGIVIALLILPPLNGLALVIGAVAFAFALIEIVRRHIQIVWLTLQAGMVGWIAAALVTSNTV